MSEFVYEIDPWSFSIFLEKQLLKRTMTIDELIDFQQSALSPILCLGTLTLRFQKRQYNCAIFAANNDSPIA